MIRSGKLLAFIALASMGTLLTACGEKKAVGPAAVKVNGEVIGVAEIEEHMAERGRSGAAATTGVPGKVIQSIVDKELLRQAAVKDKLDVDPKYHAQVVAANRMILASAYMARQIESMEKLGDADVKAYFDKHRAIYAERKEYQLEELVIRPKPESFAEVQAKLAGAKLKDLVHWLDEKNIPHKVEHITTTSDRMREDMAEKFHKAKVGDAITLAEKEKFVVIFVTAATPRSATLAEATPAIRSRLQNQRISEGVEGRLKQLRQQAKIEYVAPFTANGLPVPAQP